MRATPVLVVLAGCGYHAGRFADLQGPFPGTRFALACLDLSVGPVRDLEAHGPVVAYSFGNRCHHRVTVDLASVRVIARDAFGGQRPLVAYDPGHELERLPIDALGIGREQLEYIDPGGGIASWCVDIGGIDGSAPRTERWVCMGERDR